MDAAASILYPTMRKPEVPPAAVLGDERPAPSRSQQTAQPAAAEGDARNAADGSLFAEAKIELYPPGGSPPSDGNYDPALSDLFESAGYQVRYDKAPGWEDALSELQENREGLQVAFHRLEVGMAGVREMMIIAKEHHNNPVSEAVREATAYNAMEFLQKEYGSEAEAYLRGAREVVRVAAMTTPGLIDWLNRVGAGNDPRLIELAAKIAERRGYVR